MTDPDHGVNDEVIAPVGEKIRASGREKKMRGGHRAHLKKVCTI